jgi:2-dehydro-3-deoxygluconokinase
VTVVSCVGEPLAELRFEDRDIVRVGLGGDVANVAVGLRRLDASLDVRLHASVGDDPLSDLVVERLRAEGVTLAGPRIAGGRVGVYLVRVGPDGERTFTYWRDGSASSVRLGTKPEAVVEELQGSDVLMFSGITLALLGAHGRDVLRDALVRARRGGAFVVLDPNHRPPLWRNGGDAGEAFLNIAPAVDAVLASHDDSAELLSVNSAEEAVLRIRDVGVPDVVVTDGPRGCVTLVDGEIVRLEAFPVERVVDTTGTGDAFDAGWLVAKLRSADARECAREGLRAAAECVGHAGAL